MATAKVNTIANDPWEDMRKIRLAKAAKNETNYQYVAVNGRAYQIPKGKEVEVPFPIYDRLIKMQEAEEAADAYEREVERMAQEMAEKPLRV
jgi:hypothetical protein